MKTRIAVGLALLGLGASLTGSPALATCGKDCTTQIRDQYKSCKAACPSGPAGRECKRECRDEKKAEKATCKAATNPTPPGCGQAFTKITTGDIVTTPALFWNGSWGDYDDDGYLDLFVGATIASTRNFSITTTVMGLSHSSTTRRCRRSPATNTGQRGGTMTTTVTSI
jgi:hypothetical protein